jgi:ADP-ribose pyrophosphatase YjhB (NUDIX family)
VPPNVTRPCAFVFLRADDQVLVSEMRHPADGVWYRPPGGGIEFQESSEDAARRELREELRITIAELALLGVREETFTLSDGPYHEIDFIFEAWLTTEALAALDRTAVDLADLRGGRYTPLYPDGVADLLA